MFQVSILKMSGAPCSFVGNKHDAADFLSMHTDTDVNRWLNLFFEEEQDMRGDHQTRHSYSESLASIRFDIL